MNGDFMRKNCVMYQESIKMQLQAAGNKCGAMRIACPCESCFNFLGRKVILAVYIGTALLPMVVKHEEARQWKLSIFKRWSC